MAIDGKAVSGPEELAAAAALEAARAQLAESERVEKRIEQLREFAAQELRKFDGRSRTGFQLPLNRSSVISPSIADGHIRRDLLIDKTR